MTPTQLRAFAAVVRLGSVKAAAAELLVTEAAVSLHVGQLRKELGDQLFARTSSGLAFTPGGLRLASRAVELLGLQDRTVLEVRAAGEGRRMLRLGTSTLFAEYAAPGLIGLFAERAKDLDVELSTHRTTFFESLLMTRTVDATIGPRIAGRRTRVSSKLFLNYQVVAVTSPDHPLLTSAPSIGMLRQQTWLLGPSAAEDAGVITALLHRLGDPGGPAADLPEPRRRPGRDQARARDLADALVRGRPGPRLGPARAGDRAQPERPGLLAHLDARRRSGDPGRRGDDPLHHHPPRDPGDAPRPRGRPRPVQARRPRHPLELSATR